MQPTNATCCPVPTGNMAASKPSFLATVISRILDPSQSDASDAVVRHLRSSGGKFTDGTELSIEQALSGRGFNAFLQ